MLYLIECKTRGFWRHVRYSENKKELEKDLQEFKIMDLNNKYRISTLTRGENRDAITT